jgi:hypothetical protein
MSKLITAEEAVALSNFDANIDRHIELINTRIKWACRRHNNRASCLLDPCSKKEAIRIAAQLRAAGYCYKWESMVDDRIVRFTISWGGS